MIHHLAEPGLWEQARTGDQRAYEPASLSTEGFIHLSTHPQVAATFGRYYADRNDLVLLDVDETHPGVAPHLRMEAAPSGELFPHLYAPLPVDAVKRARPHWVPALVPSSQPYPFGEGYSDGSAPYDPSVFPWPAVDAALVDSRNYWITSVRPDGRPHAAPVWGIWLGDVLAYSSGPTAVKQRNLAANPRCVAHLESGDDVVMLEGAVERLTGHRLEAFLAGYGPKYGMVPDASNPDFGFYAMVPTTVRSWLESSFLASATLWTFSR